MRIVLDTNVFVAAYATHGLCQSILELCLDRHDIFVSRGLLVEIRRNLVKKIRLPASVAEEIVRFITSKSALVEPDVHEPNACRDPDDVLILGTATAARADFIVTGDQDLLVLKKFRGIAIASPTTFARLLKDRKA